MHTHTREHASTCSIVLAFFYLYYFCAHLASHCEVHMSVCVYFLVSRRACEQGLQSACVCVSAPVCVFLAQAAEDVGVYTDAQSDN